MNPLGPGDPLRLGPYRLVGVLGAGGMGKVYFAHDNQGRPAAVKVLLPQLSNDRHMVQRFLREAEAARSVTGRGVARVLAAQTEGGRLWIASEFLAGPTLEQAVDTYGPLPDEALRALAASLADTLGAIHAAGLIHRDLKPANIVLTSSGPRVIDFGIARPEHGLTLTTTGQVPVTPGYGAPEQVLGQRVGPAADIFSLGAVLAYAASGVRTYSGGHVAAVQYEVVHGEPDLSRVPEPLRVLIGPCLAKDPAFRPSHDQISTAFAPPRRAERIWQQGALAADIQQRETSARQWSTLPGTVVAQPPGRRRFLAGLAAGAGVLAVGGGTAAWLLKGEKEPGGPGNGGTDTTKDAKAVPAGRPVWGPLPAADPWSPPARAVDGMVLFGARDGGLVAYGAADGKKKWVDVNVTPSSEFLVLPDGLLVAVDAGGSVHAFVPSSGKEQWSAAVDAYVLLAADDEALYFMTRDKKIRAVNTKTQKILWTVTSAFGSGYAAAGGGRLVLFSDAGDVRALDRRSGQQAWERLDLSNYGAIPAIHDDTAVLAGTSLRAVRLTDGKDVWSVPTGRGAHDWSSAVIEGDRVYTVATYMLHCRRLSDGAKVWATDVSASYQPMDSPHVVGDYVCTVTAKDPKSFDAVALHKDTGKPAWTHAQGSKKSLKLTSDGKRLFLLQNETVTAVSGGVA
ncbi:serine/threonine-protein kinase [Streptomyces sp. NBC_01619]|uniref:serine/threonine-protein kinase n=1 Tax=Streptomyces sp. NBC_01619 TaxID=2975901 RepID=UPI00225BA299|nr:serine/threonine-protein kinase [Streptomyces sp. NBC_01619]MCX4508775.1 serine/threonine-protein kinase [Streptomyces sp. NBC_01619]